MCAAELPQIEAMINEYGDKAGFAIILGVPPGMDGNDFAPTLEKAEPEKYALLFDTPKEEGDRSIKQEYGAGSGFWYVVSQEKTVKAQGTKLEEAVDHLSESTGKPPLKLPALGGPFGDKSGGMQGDMPTKMQMMQSGDSETSGETSDTDDSASERDQSDATKPDPKTTPQDKPVASGKSKK